MITRLGDIQEKWLREALASSSWGYLQSGISKLEALESGYKANPIAYEVLGL